MFPFAALLISLAAFCGLSVALAFIMVVADATVGNYGDIKVGDIVETFEMREKPRD